MFMTSKRKNSKIDIVHDISQLSIMII